MPQQRRGDPAAGQAPGGGPKLREVGAQSFHQLGIRPQRQVRLTFIG